MDLIGRPYVGPFDDLLPYRPVQGEWPTTRRFAAWAKTGARGIKFYSTRAMSGLDSQPVMETSTACSTVAWPVQKT